MDRAPDLHLQPQELAELDEQARQHADSPPEATEIHPHLASCLVCRELFQELSVVENRLAGLRSAQPGPRQAACPDPSAWYEIVAGVTPPAEALVHVLHASRYDGCGPLLREAVAALNGEMTASEAEQIAALASARPEWQRKLAQQIAGTSMLAPIAGQLAAHPSDAYWLQAKARVDLLEGKYEPAVESLRHALQLQPKSPSILTDLASAYFQRGQAADRPEDYAAAYEHLSQALAVAPDDPVALFNRAIVSERQFLNHQALDDWEHYLRIDPRSDWADEARKRADAVRAKLKQHESANRPRLSPVEIAASATPPADLDQRVEQYLDAAVQSWLPAAYPETNSTADPNARQALFFLADLTNQQHSDHWLSDLLGGSSSPGFPQAIAALARSVQANDAGEYDTSRQQAARAERLFRSSGNVAGALRAQFEQVFSAQFSRRVAACRRQAAAALTESEQYPYPWLQIQLGLEAGLCSGLMGDLGVDQRAARRAMDRAQQNAYGALYLRALGFVAEDKFESGDPAGGWRLASSGLERYWAGQFPAMRGYNFYTNFVYGAEVAGRPNLQVAVLREALALIDSDPDLLLRATAHYVTANAAVAAGQPRIATEQYAEAARLFALAPQQHEATRASRLENEIRMARLEARLGEFDAALTRLTRAQSEIRQDSNSYLALMFYSTLGEAQLRRLHPLEADQALRPALTLAERSLASLNSEAERIGWSRDAAPVYLALVEAELVQGYAQEALDAFEWYLGAPQRVEGERTAPDSTSARTTARVAPDPSRITSRLPFLSQQTVIAYGLLPDGLAIWVYDDRGISLQWSPQPTQGTAGAGGKISRPGF